MDFALGESVKQGTFVSASTTSGAKKYLDTIERNTLDTIERNMFDTIDKKSEKYKDWGNDATQGGKTDGKLRKNEGIENFVLIFLQHENRIVFKKS